MAYETVDYVQRLPTAIHFLLTLSSRAQVISDLATPEAQNLKVKESIDGNIWVEGIAEPPVASPDEFLDLMELGMKNRKVRATVLRGPKTMLVGGPTAYVLASRKSLLLTSISSDADGKHAHERPQQPIAHCVSHCHRKS